MVGADAAGMRSTWSGALDVNRAGRDAARRAARSLPARLRHHSVRQREANAVHVTSGGCAEAHAHEHIALRDRHGSARTAALLLMVARLSLVLHLTPKRPVAATVSLFNRTAEVPTRER